MTFNQMTFCPEHLTLKVPNVEFDFDLSADNRLCQTDRSKLNSMLGTHLHALIRTRHFDLDVRF